MEDILKEDYITVKEAAKKWNVKLRTAHNYLENGRIPNAIKFGYNWLIPKDSEKPKDRRFRDARDARDDIKNN